MESIEKNLQEISSYVKGKVLNGDYDFIKCGEHTAEIKIDDRYVFQMWIANNPKYSFNFYEGFMVSFGRVKVLEFTNQKDRLKAWRKIKPYIQEHREKVLRRQKQKEINRLQKELDAIKD